MTITEETEVESQTRPNITQESMRKALEQAVGKKGRDFLYVKAYVGDYGPMCLYRRNGEPSCLFGHALEILGEEYSSEWEHCNIREVLFSLSVDDLDLLDACSEAQIRQDGGKTWGEALDAFNATLAKNVTHPA